MSAWMCTDRHIAFLAKAAEVHGLVPDAGELAVKMKAENVNSLMFCYPTDWWELTGFGGPGDGDTLVVKVEAEISDLVGHIENPAWVNKQAACFRYQSCEHPGWDGSETQTVLEALIDLTADHDPASYAAAPWGVA